MKMLCTVSILFALTTSAFADPPKGSGSGAAPSGATVSDADVKLWLAFWDKLVDTVVADKDQCAKMGTDLNALIDANKDLMDKAQKARADGKQLPADARKHMQDTAPKMAAMMGCTKDATVKSAMQRLNLGRPQQTH